MPKHLRETNGDRVKLRKAHLIDAAGRVPGLSDALRWYARRYPEGSTVRIKSGEAEGMHWRRHHRYVNGYWTGQYELSMQAALRRELKPGSVFYDVGANAGFFSLVAAKLVGPSGRVVSFDPDPDNHQSISEQIAVNSLAEMWTAECKGVADRCATVVFERESAGSPKGHLKDLDTEGFNATSGGVAESFDVELITLDTALETHPPPSVIKMDIEGAETMAMRGAERVLRDHRPTWLIETHGPKSERVVRETLLHAGYRFFRVEGQPLPDPETNLPRHFVARPTS